MLNAISLASITAILSLSIYGAYIARPCPSEDGIACTWNATTQGNGTGHSFTAISERRAIYWN
ncbi:hypothetical protein [uncultured Pelagimonas sp.]|uniref:hypothetical protein n=1 Tax=uncultured Pelagimonas sp. TaxID=1618102 RepID=UPI00261FCF94|nr:hypothetical protein [uncultured Pelagimonas sp.]